MIDPKRLWKHMTVLCEDIGPRMAGSEGDRRAVEYISRHFERCGASVEVQEYPCPSWEHRETRLSILNDGESATLPALGTSFTLPCDVEGELDAVGTRWEIEYRGDLKDKVLVIYGELLEGINIDRNKTLLSVEERKPAAIIVVGDREETYITKLVRDPFLSVPCASVSMEVGRELLRSRGKSAHLRIEARRFDSKSYNVIGRLRGEEEGRIIVCAHYDSAAETPGALDNASGTAVVLEMCEVLSKAPLRKDVDCIAFGAEEYGRHTIALGSVEYVRQKGNTLGDLRWVVAVDDVAGYLSTPQLYLMGCTSDGEKEIRRIMRTFPRYGVSSDEMFGSDHVPFYRMGVPALVFMDIKGWNGPHHTPLDTLDKVDPEGLAYAARVIETVLGGLAA